MTDVATSYEANTVEELRDELRARGLHTSGNKDELVARLEEDDAKLAAEGETVEEEEAQVEAQAEEPPDYYPPIVYSQFELPANTAAAQAFYDAHPDAVSQDELDPGRHELALANIQEHVDSMAAVGVTIEDPRLTGSGGGGPAPGGPHIDSLNPDTAATDEQVTITVSGSGFDDTSTVEINGAGQTTTFGDASTLTVDHQPTAAGTETFTVRNGDNQESNNMTFTVT